MPIRDVPTSPLHLFITFDRPPGRGAVLTGAMLSSSPHPAVTPEQKQAGMKHAVLLLISQRGSMKEDMDALIAGVRRVHPWAQELAPLCDQIEEHEKGERGGLRLIKG